MKNKRQLILDAVTKLVEQNKGNFSITISQIAKQAGIGKGTVYEYFNSKEEIFIEVMKTRIFVWLEYIEGELTRSDLTFDDKIRTFFERATEIIDFNVSMQTMQQQMISMLKNNDKIVEQIYEMKSLYNSRFKQLQRYIYESGVISKRVRGDMEFSQFSLSFEIFMSGVMTTFFRRQQEGELDKTKYKETVGEMFYKIFS